MAPLGRLTVSLMLPLPLAVKPEAPPLPTAVYVSLVIAAGRTSVTVAPVTLLGPLLQTTIVYVAGPPAPVCSASILVMTRLAFGVRVSTSLAVLLPGSGRYRRRTR